MRLKAFRRSAINLGLLLAASALSIVALETGIRLYEAAFLIHHVDPDESVYDLERYAYNDHEGILAREREPDEFRILSFGDSFAASVTLAPYTYASVLQLRLSPFGMNRRVRVVNFGRRGTSFPDYLSQLRVWTGNVEFDAVLLNLYAGNDFTEPTEMLFVAAAGDAYRPNQANQTLRYGPGVAIPRRFRLRFIDYLYAHYYLRAYGSSAATGVAADREFYRPRAPQFPRDEYLNSLKHHVGVYRTDRVSSYFRGHYWLFKLLEEARALEEGGTPVAVTVAPSHLVVDDRWRRDVLAGTDLRPDQLVPGLPAAVVRRIARAAGFEGPILDLTACLRAANARGEPVYWGTNSHWSVRGNQLVGDLLADALSRLWFEEGDGPIRGCNLAPEPLPAAASAQLDDSVRAVQALLRFERTVLPALVRQTFETPAALAAALEGAGYTLSPDRIRGAYWGFRDDEGPGWSRPHGLRDYIEPQGWAIDEDAPGQSVLVAFFDASHLVGVGRTAAGPGAHAIETGAIPDHAPTAVFRSLIPPLESPGELRVVAISPGGHFAPLPYEPKASLLE